MRYLLDTNIVSDLIRHPGGPVARRIADVGVAAVCTNVIVAGELRYGAAKKQSPLLSARIEAVLAELEVLPLEPPTDLFYGKIRVALERIGRPIGGNDLLIAAHAKALGYTVVTANDAEFGRVEGLAVENWLGD